MLEKTTIHGYRVQYETEDDVKSGVAYLRDDLAREEATVFFDQARLKGSAQFEADNENQYTLTYSRDGIYTLLRRQSSGSFF
ncbi:MAG: hypothetical protein HY435_03205 [Candidatus Liptonbacteria bacterium]|nr:hypothetical protein [Candidatus Liptonbacteria bacterium]